MYVCLCGIVCYVIIVSHKFQASLDFKMFTFIFANGKFILSIARPGCFCIIIGEGTVQCYLS